MELIAIVIIIIVIILALLLLLYWNSAHEYLQPGMTCVGGTKSDRTGGVAKREIEARFLDVDVDDIRKKLKKIGAKREYDRTLLYRTVYALPNGYVRIRVEPRDGKSRIVLTSKIYPRSSATTAEKAAPIETEVTLSRHETYQDAREFMASLGLSEKTQAEQYREEWRAKGADCVFDIDWLPGMAPSLEIECASDAEVREFAKVFDLNYASATFGAYARAYERVYGIPQDVINNQLSELKFESVQRLLGPFVVKNKDQFNTACETRLRKQ